MLPKEATRPTTRRRVRALRRKREAISLIDRVEGFLLSNSQTQDRVALAFIALATAYFLGHVVNYLLK